MFTTKLSAPSFEHLALPPREMPSDHELFINAAHAHNQDSLIPLVHADWLEEHGHERRATQMRFDVAASQWNEIDLEGHWRMRAAHRELSKQVEYELRVEFGKSVKALQFENGYARAVAVWAHNPELDLAVISAKTPLRHLCLELPETLSFRRTISLPKGLEELSLVGFSFLAARKLLTANAPLLDNIRTFSLQNAKGNVEEFNELISALSHQMPLLTSLELDTSRSFISTRSLLEGVRELTKVKSLDFAQRGYNGDWANPDVANILRNLSHHKQLGLGLGEVLSGGDEVTLNLPRSESVLFIGSEQGWFRLQKYFASLLGDHASLFESDSFLPELAREAASLDCDRIFWNAYVTTESLWIPKVPFYSTQPERRGWHTTPGRLPALVVTDGRTKYYDPALEWLFRQNSTAATADLCHRAGVRFLHLPA